MISEVVQFFYSLWIKFLGLFIPGFLLSYIVKDHKISKLHRSCKYEEWLASAQQLDESKGLMEWREDPESPYYNTDMIIYRVSHMNELYASQEFIGMASFLRTAMARNIGGISNPNLYTKCNSGTKTLIEYYVDQVVYYLYWIAGLDQEKVESRPQGRGLTASMTLNGKTQGTALGQLAASGQLGPSTQRGPSTLPCIMEIVSSVPYSYFVESLQSLGRSGLVLTGGLSLGLYHLGVVKALHEQEILPWIICGSRMGALVGSMVCALTPSQLDDFFRADTGRKVNLDVFSEVTAEGAIMRRLMRFLRKGHFFDVKVLERFARDNIGDLTFEEAYQRSGRLLNIVVTSQRSNEVPGLLNHLTAPEVVVWSAACASCVIPGMYETVTLLQKTPEGDVVPWNEETIRWTNADRWNAGQLPLHRLTQLFNVNHFIVSDIRAYNHWLVASAFPRIPVPRSAPLLMKLFGAAWSELQHWLRQLQVVGLLPAGLQRHAKSSESPWVAASEGDRGEDSQVLHLCPTLDVSDMAAVMTHPSEQLIAVGVDKGYRYCFAHLSKLRVLMRIEMALERILRILKTRSPELAPMYEQLQQQGSEEMGLDREEGEGEGMTEEPYDKAVAMMFRRASSTQAELPEGGGFFKDDRGRLRQVRGTASAHLRRNHSVD